MGSIVDLERIAGIRVQNVGQLQLVRAEDAPAFLRACLRCDVGVLGAEGFDVVDGHKVRPDMSVILDLSGVEDIETSIAEAEQFVEEVARPDLFLEFTLSCQAD